MGKFLLVTLFKFLAFSLWANMASPVQEGHTGALPFLNQYVSIISETIAFQPDSQWQEARFIIQYTIEVEKEGIKVPLLFQAMDYYSDFKFNLDGIPIDVQPLPVEALWPDEAVFKDFDYLLESGEPLRVYWEEDYFIEEDVYNLKYLEVDLPAGRHQIEILYIASSWTEASGLVKTSGFKYALAPARYWKSFGQLAIHLRTKKPVDQIESNLGKGTYNESSNVISWQFDSIPVDVFSINWVPPISEKGAQMHEFGAFNMMLLLGFLLATLHYWLITRFRRKNATGFNWVMLVGSIVLPLVVLGSYTYFLDLIDDAIGNEASRRHGYSFLITGFYIFVMPVYLLLATFWDLFLKRRNRQQV